MIPPSYSIQVFISITDGHEKWNKAFKDCILILNIDRFSRDGSQRPLLAPQESKTAAIWNFLKRSASRDSRATTYTDKTDSPYKRRKKYKRNGKHVLLVSVNFIFKAMRMWNLSGLFMVRLGYWKGNKNVKNEITMPEKITMPIELFKMKLSPRWHFIEKRFWPCDLDLFPMILTFISLYLNINIS